MALVWTDPDRLLGEPRPTQVDVLAIGSKAALVIECKFTEPGGQCSQTTVSRSGDRQCNGTYAEQINPRNGVRAHYALTGKGIRYWEYIPKVFKLDPGVDRTPCPFKGDAYQWMRNAVLAAAIGKHRNLQAAALATFADHPSFPTARKANETFHLTQRERIALGLLAQHEALTARELAGQLDLLSIEAVQPWIRRLLEWNFVQSSGRTQATRYFVDPALLRGHAFISGTTLKRIEPHRLVALIVEDVGRYPQSKIGDIHKRVGLEIPRSRIRRSVEQLVRDGKLKSEGVRSGTRYSLP